jgi:hypothetical protein
VHRLVADIAGIQLGIGGGRLNREWRFADIAREELTIAVTKGAPEDVRAVRLFEGTLGSAALAASDVVEEAALSDAADPSRRWTRRAPPRRSPNDVAGNKLIGWYEPPFSVAHRTRLRRQHVVRIESNAFSARPPE